MASSVAWTSRLGWILDLMGMVLTWDWGIAAALLGVTPAEPAELHGVSSIELITSFQLIFLQAGKSASKLLLIRWDFGSGQS